MYLFENVALNIFCELTDAYFNARIRKRNLCKLFAVRLPNTRLDAWTWTVVGFLLFSNHVNDFERCFYVLPLLQMTSGKNTRSLLAILVFMSLKESCWLWKKPKVCLDDQGVLFEDETSEGLVSRHRCSEFQNTSCIVVQLDHNSLWYL